MYLISSDVDDILSQLAFVTAKKAHNFSYQEREPLDDGKVLELTCLEIFSFPPSPVTMTEQQHWRGKPSLVRYL